MNRFRWFIVGGVILLGGIVVKDQCFRPHTGNLEIHEESVRSKTSVQLLEGPALVRQELLAHLAATPALPFPASIPWAASYKIGVNNLYSLETILHYQPLLFFRMALDRHDREVGSYSLTFLKQETVNGRKFEQEKIKVHFREKPFSVFFDWESGATLAQRVLYVAGENEDQMRVRPRGLAGFLTVSRPVDGADAKSSGRYTIKQFGLKQALERTLHSMDEADARGALHIRYDGIVKVDKLNHRPCYKFVRTPYQPPEEEGVNELTLYIDIDTWLQVGSILKDSQGKVLAEYFFDDIRINPEYPAGLFTPKSL